MKEQPNRTSNTKMKYGDLLQSGCKGLETDACWEGISTDSHVVCHYNLLRRASAAQRALPLLAFMLDSAEKYNSDLIKQHFCVNIPRISFMEIVTFMEGHHLAAFRHLILPVVVVKASVGVDRCQQTLANSVNKCDTVKGSRCL